MALLGNEAVKPETMAAMALIERMERLFRRGTPSNVHTKGILQVVKMKGPPKLKDHLDVAVANELYGILVSHAKATYHETMDLTPLCYVVERLVPERELQLFQ
jgi:hypothetical protein